MTGALKKNYAGITRAQATARNRNFTIFRLRSAYGVVDYARRNPQILCVDVDQQKVIVEKCKKGLASIDDILYALGAERESLRIEERSQAVEDNK